MTRKVRTKKYGKRKHRRSLKRKSKKTRHFRKRHMHKSKKRRQKMRGRSRRTRYKKKGGLNVFTLIKRDPIKNDCAMVHKYDPNKMKRQNDSERVEAYEQCKKANRALRDAMETRDVLVLRDAIATAEQENVASVAMIEKAKALVPELALEAEVRQAMEKRDLRVLRSAIATAEQENVVDAAVIEEAKALVPVLAAEIRRAKEKYYQTPDGAMDLYRQYINT
jgi:hypothetical protein